MENSEQNMSAALNPRQVEKIEAGVAAADRGEFASDADLARVRKNFAAKE